MLRVGGRRSLGHVVSLFHLEPVASLSPFSQIPVTWFVEGRVHALQRNSGRRQSCTRKEEEEGEEAGIDGTRMLMGSSSSRTFHLVPDRGGLQGGQPSSISQMDSAQGHGQGHGQGQGRRGATSRVSLNAKTATKFAQHKDFHLKAKRK